MRAGGAPAERLSRLENIEVFAKGKDLIAAFPADFREDTELLEVVTRVRSSSSPHCVPWCKYRRAHSTQFPSALLNRTAGATPTLSIPCPAATRPERDVG